MVKDRSLLLVEDDESVRDALTKVLTGEGYRVLSATSGCEALVQFRKQPVDVVLLDLNLSGEDGWDAFHALKEISPNLPIVVTSAQSERFAHSSAKRAEATLEKPFDLALLLMLLQGGATPRNGLAAVVGRIAGVLVLCAALFGFVRPASAVQSPLRISSIEVQNDNVVLQWQGGGGGASYQVQVAQDVSGPWQNLGGPTSGTSLSYPALWPNAFFRVMIAGQSAPDVTPPTATMVSPTDGSIVSGSISLAANAVDGSGGSGISRVEFYADSGQLLGSATAAPYTVVFDTRAMLDGRHGFYSKAYDAAGNSGNSATVTATVSNGGSTFAPGSCLWSRAWVGGSSFDNSDARAVAVDSGGNVIMAGYFNGTVTGNGGTLSGGNPGLLVAKYSPSGALLWAKSFSPTLNRAAIYGLGVDGSDNIIIAGGFSGTLDFGGGPLVNGNYTIYNTFLTKLSSAGAHIWSKQFGGDGGAVPTSLAVDGSGNIVLAGSFGQTLNFGGGLPVLTSAGGSDIFVAKFSGTGTPAWAKAFGGLSLDYVNACVVDGTGSIIIGGYFMSPSINFGNGAMVNQGGRDGFIAKLTSGGAVQATRQFGGTGDAYVNGLAVDANNNIVACGAFTTLVDCGGGLLTSGPGNAIWIAKFSSSLGHVWSKSYGGLYNDAGYGVGVDRGGNIYLTGHAQSAIDFGGGVWTLSNGNNNVFVTKFNGDGGAIWGKRFPTGAVDNDGFRLAFDPQNNPIVTGHFAGVIDFGSGPLTSSPTWGNAAFLVKLAQ